MTNETEIVNSALNGKTIVKIEMPAINAWVFHFSDGSKNEMYTDTDGPMGLPVLYLSENEDVTIANNNDNFRTGPLEAPIK